MTTMDDRHTRTDAAAEVNEPGDGDLGDGEYDADAPTVGDLIHAEAEGVVKTGVIGAMAVGVIPVPVVDIVGVTGVSLNMLKSLSEVYEVPFSESLGRAALVALLPSLVPVALVGGAGSLIKALPGLGTVAGTGGVSVVSGAVTYAVGHVFIKHFEAGGTVADFNPGPAVRDRFKRAFAEGWEVVTALIERLDAPPPKPRGRRRAAGSSRAPRR